MAVRSDATIFYGVRDSLAFRIYQEADPTQGADITGETAVMRISDPVTGATIITKTGVISGTAPGPQDATFTFLAADFGDSGTTINVGQYPFAVTLEAGGDEPEVVAHGYLTVVRAAGFVPA